MNIRMVLLVAASVAGSVLMPTAAGAANETFEDPVADVYVYDGVTNWAAIAPWPDDIQQVEVRYNDDRLKVVVHVDDHKDIWGLGRVFIDTDGSDPGPEYRFDSHSENGNTLYSVGRWEAAGKPVTCSGAKVTQDYAGETQTFHVPRRCIDGKGKVRVAVVRSASWVLYGKTSYFYDRAPDAEKSWYDWVKR